MSQNSVVLIIMDGWGYRKEKHGNAILHAKTPTFDKLDMEFPPTLIQASGLEVGLPDGQMGNSEVGHLNIGAGRVVYQELPRISNSIKDGSFFSNKALLNAIEHSKKACSERSESNPSLHLMGLLSDGGVHSHIEHIFALIEMAKRNGVKNLFIHPFLDGRDRTKKAYDALVHGMGNFTGSAEEALHKSYQNQVTDEFMIPVVIVDSKNNPVGTIKNGESVIFYNL